MTPSRSLWIKLLTMHSLMAPLLLALLFLPILLNSAFLFMPLERTVELSLYLLAWFHGLWLFAVAAEIGAVKVKHGRIFSLVAVLIFLGLFVYVFYIQGTVIAGIDREELNSIIVVMYISIVFALSALIASTISDTMLGRITHFWAAMHWPLFLFLISSRLRMRAHNGQHQ